MSANETSKGGSNRKYVIAAAVIVVIAAVVVVVFGGRDPATELVRGLPEETLTVEAADGTAVEITVSNASGTEARNTGFNGVDAEVVADTVLFIETAHSATSPLQVENLNAAIELAFFDADGELLNVFEAEPEEERSITPQERYKYVLLAQSGFFEEQGIGEESQLLGGTLQPLQD